MGMSLLISRMINVNNEIHKQFEIYGTSFHVLNIDNEGIPTNENVTYKSSIGYLLPLAVPDLSSYSIIYIYTSGKEAITSVDTSATNYAYYPPLFAPLTEISETYEIFRWSVSSRNMHIYLIYSVNGLTIRYQRYGTDSSQYGIIYSEWPGCIILIK